MIKNLKNIRPSLVLGTTLTLAVLCSGCPGSESALSCLPSGATLDFQNNTAEAMNVQIKQHAATLTAPRDKSFIKDETIQVKAGDHHVLSVENGTYSVLVLEEKSGATLYQNSDVVISCGSPALINISDSWQGTKQYGASSMDIEADAIAVGPKGNVYVAGSISAIGLEKNLYVAGYSAAGLQLWTQRLGAVSQYGHVGNAEAFSIATDAKGNVYVAGDTNADLDGNKLTGTADSFLVSYDEAGKRRWTRLLGAGGYETNARSVVTDVQGNIYVIGDTTGDLIGKSNKSTGRIDFFIASYNAAGDKNWIRQFGGSGFTSVAFGAATDGAGNIYVTGATDGMLGGIKWGNGDLFLMRYNVAGDVVNWTRQLGAFGAETEAAAVTTDAIGNVYVTGSTKGDLNGNKLAGTGDLFLTTYSSDGVWLRTRQLGSPGAYTAAQGVVADGKGNVYVTGFTDGALDGNKLTGSRDMFVAAYNADGVTPVWTKQFGALPHHEGFGRPQTSAQGIAIDAKGNLFITGYTWGDLDGNKLPSDLEDLFLMKFDSSGVKQ